MYSSQYNFKIWLTFIVKWSARLITFFEIFSLFIIPQKEGFIKFKWYFQINFWKPIHFVLIVLLGSNKFLNFLIF